MDEAPIHNTAKEIDYYAVSTSKLTVLYLATLGLYSYYWFYQHWKRQQPFIERKISPLLRSFFSLFFTHALAKRIQKNMSERGLPERKNLALIATFYIVLALAAGITSKIAEQPDIPRYFYLIWLALLYLSVFPLVELQHKVNLLLDDPLGKENENYSGLNIVFILVGIVLWGLTLVGIIVYVPESN